MECTHEHRLLENAQSDEGTLQDPKKDNDKDKDNYKDKDNDKDKYIQRTPSKSNPRDL